ncbi:MAG: penicillin-binding protein 1A, partial [Elusimicrobiota bacterium]
MKTKINLKLSILIILLILIGASIFGRQKLKSMSEELPSTSSLVQYRPELVTEVYDHKGKLINELFIERRTLVPLQEMPDNLINALLAMEDTNFFNHWGLDITAVLRAALRNFTKGRIVQGGSTITQQLAKVMFLTSERTYKRKIQELMLALQIEKQFSKEEILQFYLNHIYFGMGAYGVETASRIYFDKNVNELTLAESAMLAGLPRAPNAYSPGRNMYKAYTRRAIVLNRMESLGLISAEEKMQANAEPMPGKTFREVKKPGDYFVEHIRRKLMPVFGKDKLYRGGLRIYTTLDLQMQEKAELALDSALENQDNYFKEDILEEIMEENEDLESIEEVKLSTSAMKQAEEKFKKAQGSIVAIDPKVGQVRVMVGGRDFEESEFNRVTQSKRQPGSAFKPFVYAAALDHGFTPADILYDEARVYYNDGRDWILVENATKTAQLGIHMDEIEDEEKLEEIREKVWAPTNYYRAFDGKATFRDALVRSLNAATIDLIEQIRPITAYYYARQMGIKSRLSPSLSLALGTSEVTPLELTAAYSVFANDGISTRPYSIIRVEDYAGNTLIENQPEEKQVISPQTNYIMVNLLEQVCEYGTGQ